MTIHAQLEEKTQSLSLNIGKSLQLYVVCTQQTNNAFV